MLAAAGSQPNTRPSVSPERRFTRAHPCPICGGNDRQPRGRGERCHGFLSSDGLYAHCSREEHAGSLRPKTNGTYPHRLDGDCRCGRRHGSFPVDPAPQGSNGAGQRIVDTYDYVDEARELLYQVCRTDPKGFFQRRPDGAGGWINNLNGTRRVLYRLPELLAAGPADPVFVVEGEKDVDRLRGLGLVATCNAAGAGKWRPEYAEALRGRRVVVLPDADDPGRAHAEAVAHSLHGVAASVKVVEL